MPANDFCFKKWLPLLMKRMHPEKDLEYNFKLLCMPNHIASIFICQEFFEQIAKKCGNCRAGVVELG